MVHTAMYSECKKNQHGNRVIASDLKNPDFMKLADAFGVQGMRVNTPDALRQAIPGRARIKRANPHRNTSWGNA